MLFYCFFVIRESFSFFERYCIFGSSREAISETVAVIISDEDRFAFFDGDGSLVAGICAKSATGTFVLVYFNYPANHFSYRFLY